MKFGNIKTDFNADVKKYSWSRFRDTFGKNTAVMLDFHKRGLTLESAFTLITGKQIPASKPVSKQKPKKESEHVSKDHSETEKGQD